MKASPKYPQNYDFGNNWKSKIVPHLDDPKIKKAIKDGINSYLRNFPKCTKTYSNTRSPASYSSKDGYDTLMTRKKERLIETLKADGLVPKEYIKLEKQIESLEDDDDDLMNELSAMEEEILEPYFVWNEIKYDLESYYLSGSCHWWAPTFELTLAKIVEPKEEWIVRVGEKHTTVINKKKTKVFDLLYWADAYRLEEYVFGDIIPFSKRDKTLGGKAAYLDSK